MEKLDKLVSDFVVTDEDIREIEGQRSLYQSQIGRLESEMKDKEHRTMKLRGQAIQERADHDAEITKSQEKERAELAALQPDSMSALAALREYQKTAAGKKKADRSTVVIPTNKNASDA